MRSKIDWASLIVGSKFTVFALFYYSVFEGNFPSTSPRGLYLEGRVNGGFFALPVWGRGLYLEGLIHGGLIFGILWYLFYSDQRNVCFCRATNYELCEDSDDGARRCNTQLDVWQSGGDHSIPRASFALAFDIALFLLNLRNF